MQSGQLCLRELQAGEFSLLYALLSNPQVMRYTFLDARGEEGVLPYFRQILKNNETVIDRPAYEFGAFLRENGRFVGLFDLEMQVRNEHGGWAELGYLLLPEYWGKGYATEGAELLLAYGFEHLQLHRISASCHAGNAASERIMQKIGMQKEGEFRQSRWKNGAWHNALKYAILKSEWQEKIHQ